MLSWFKKKKKEIHPIDFAQIGIDMHSHLIPSIDDGAKDLNDSITLINMLYSHGFKKIITTPHIMTDFYKNNIETISSGLKKVKEELLKQSIDIKIEAAAEYFVDYDFKQKILGGEKFLTLGDNYILIEFSFLTPPHNYLETIFQLQLKGYKVILAHVERYPYLSKSDLKDFVSRGVYLQLNVLSSIGYYSNDVRTRANWLIDNNMISFIGTDCHNLDQTKLYDKCKIEPMLSVLLNSGKLLNDQLM
tara:strand:+ start:2261 stop:3001 length:741 start_codon:yes stop_codon:yes gene_type:complete